MDTHQKGPYDDDFELYEEAEDESVNDGVTSVVNISDKMLAELLTLRSEVDSMHASIELIRNAQVHQGVALAELTGLCRERGRLCGAIVRDRPKRSSSGGNGR